MPLDQYSIFFTISLLATAISLVLALSAIRFHAPGSRAFMWMMAAVSLWTGAIAAGMLSPNQEAAFVWIILRMVGVILAPVAWFFLVIHYTERPFLNSRLNILLILIIPSLSLILFTTNNLHHLFVREISYTQVRGLLIDETWTLGPYFLVHVLYSYGLILIGDILLLKEAIKIAYKFRRQAIAIVLATIIPLLVNLSYTFHFIPSLKINYDPLGFVFTGMILAWGIYFTQLFDLSPIARRLLVDNMVDGMIVVNSNQDIVDLNPAAERIFRIDQSVIGTSIDSLLQRLNLPSILAFGSGQRHSYEFIKEDEVMQSYEVQASAIFGHRALRGRLLTIRNVTDQKKIEKQLQEIAITDALTGLANHRHFYELLEQEEERSRRTGKPFSVIMFDIDHFKKVNDTHGHLAGDQILRQIAICSKEGLRRYDILCRYGGEEFAAILAGSDLHSACATAERLRSIVAENNFNIGDLGLKISISLGVSCYEPAESPTLLELVDKADKALYHSKAHGRNQATCWLAGEMEKV